MLDDARLAALAARVDGGAWLRVDGVPVDRIYRDVDRVRAAWAQARAGRFTWHARTGHPLGVLDVAHAGELALGRLLADPSGRLAELRLALPGAPPGFVARAHGLLAAVGAGGPGAGPDTAAELVADVRRSCPTR